jgi:release factor glutamine methyltransferase
MTLKKLTDVFKKAGIESPEREAALMFMHFSGVSSASLLLDPSFDGDELLAAIERRLLGEPLAYILGECEFYSERYFVTKDCLIPRADTECIVEYAIKNLPRGAFFADLCTGSGCIAISILAHRPDCRAVACDICDGAVEMAKKNAIENKVASRLEILSHDVLVSALDGSFDAVISNPPYIRRDVLPTLSREVQNEPTAALDGGEDGLVFYRRICELYRDKIKENGFLLFETGFDQKEDIQSIAKESSLDCLCFNDYAGVQRGAVMTKL